MSCILCLQCGLRDLSVEIVPFVALWIHENPLFKRTSFWNLVECIKPRYSFLQPCQAFRFLFAWHGRVDMHFQLSPRILDGFFIFFVFRNNIVYASHPSRIIEFWLLVCPLLLLPLLSGCPNFSLYFRPHPDHISSWRLSTIVRNL